MEKQTWLCATGLSKKGKASLKKFLRQNFKPVYKGQLLTPDIISAYEYEVEFNWCDHWKTGERFWYGSFEIPAYQTKSGHPEVFRAENCELVFEEFDIED